MFTWGILLRAVLVELLEAALWPQTIFNRLFLGLQSRCGDKPPTTEGCHQNGTAVLKGVKWQQQQQQQQQQQHASLFLLFWCIVCACVCVGVCVCIFLRVINCCEYVCRRVDGNIRMVYRHFYGGGILNRTYGAPKNLYIELFLPTIIGPIYYGPP